MDGGVRHCYRVWSDPSLTVVTVNTDDESETNASASPGSSLVSNVHPDDVHRAQQAFATLLGGADHAPLPYRRQRRCGADARDGRGSDEWAWFRCSAWLETEGEVCVVERACARLEPAQPFGVRRLFVPDATHAEMIELADRGCDVACMAALAAWLSWSVLSRVVSVDVASNTAVGDAGASCLAAALAYAPALRAIDLSHCAVHDAGARALAEAISGSVELRTLALVGNHLTPAGVDSLASALPFAKLEALHLSSNVAVGALGASHLAAALLFDPPLRILRLDACRLGPEGALTLAGALRANANLTSLWLGGNGLGDTDAAAIGASLTDAGARHRLSALDLSSNPITACGLRAIIAATVEDVDAPRATPPAGAESPRANPSAQRPTLSVIRTLVLSHTCVGDEGARLISGVLRDPQCRLKRVALERSSVGDAGVGALARALARNTTLRTLLLSGNALTVAAARPLGFLLAHTLSLRELQLRDAGPAFNATACCYVTAGLLSNERLPLQAIGGFALASALERLGIHAPAEAAASNKQLLAWIAGASPGALTAQVGAPPERAARATALVGLVPGLAHDSTLGPAMPHVERVPFDASELRELHRYFFMPLDVQNGSARVSPQLDDGLAGKRQRLIDGSFAAPEVFGEGRGPTAPPPTFQRRRIDSFPRVLTAIDLLASFCGQSGAEPSALWNGELWSGDDAAAIREEALWRILTLLRQLRYALMKRGDDGWIVRRMLVVDDSAVERRMLSAALERASYTVDVASNGADALARMQEQLYDIVFMDVQMPVMDGLTSTSMLRRWEAHVERDQRQRVCVLTSCEGSLLSEARNNGVDYFEHKPPKIRSLLQIARNHRPGLMELDEFEGTRAAETIASACGMACGRAQHT